MDSAIQRLNNRSLMYIANTIRKLTILEWKVYVASQEFQDLPKQNAEANIEIRGGTIRDFSNNWRWKKNFYDYKFINYSY